MKIIVQSEFFRSSQPVEIDTHIGTVRFTPVHRTTLFTGEYSKDCLKVEDGRYTRIEVKCEQTRFKTYVPGTNLVWSTTPACLLTETFIDYSLPVEWRK